MSRAGAEFESLAATVYGELDPSATVTLDDHIVGRSGIVRQVDVSVRAQVAATAILLVIETKDYGRPADVGEVEAFAAKLEDIRANRGVLVCRSGFTSGAVAVAAQRGIELANLHDAGSRDWNLEMRVPILWVDRRPEVRFDLVALLSPGDAVPAGEEWLLRNRETAAESGVPDLFKDLWNRGELPRGTGSHAVPVPTLGTDLRVTDSAGRPAWRPIAHLDFVYDVSDKTYLGEFTPEECRGIWKYDSEAFVASYLPLESLPSSRDPTWPEIEDPQRLAIETKGTIVTTEGWAIESAPHLSGTRVVGGDDPRAGERSAYWRKKLANKMTRRAMGRRCIVCGSYDVTRTRMATCTEHQLAQKYGVCEAHGVPLAWPPGMLSTLDWMVDNGFGVPLAMFKSLLEEGELVDPVQSHPHHQLRSV